MLSYKRLFMDVHVIQTLPPSNINRDDSGSPKTAQYGGVRRARVSSQAWKRAMRLSEPSVKRYLLGYAEKVWLAAMQEQLLFLCSDIFKINRTRIKWLSA